MAQKTYYAQVLANQDVWVKAKNKREARKKIIESFKKRPGKLEIDDIEEVEGRGYTW